MSRALPLCVIGGGLVGLRHARIAHSSPAVDLTAVVEVDPVRREEIAASGLPVAADMAGVPARTEAAVIAVPTRDHFACSLEAISKSWALLVEKPIAGTVGEADRLIGVAEEAGLPLFTGHHRRCHRLIAGFKKRLPSIGLPVAVQGLWSLRKHDDYFDIPWRMRSGGGPLMINLSHDLEMLIYLLGPIASVDARSACIARGGSMEDTAALIMAFECGALGSYLLSDAGASPWSFESATGENPTLGYSGEDCMVVIGDRGALGFPSGVLWEAAAGESPDWRNSLVRDRGRSAMTGRSDFDPLAEQISRFVRALEGQEVDLCSGAQGRDALAATLACVLSAQQGRTIALTGVPPHYDGS
ncbi:MAG: Gfo/Idh/MocA family oxidoreductase [Ectothiorhodospiraceae bacterium AqS1]|nr:Gfo/Idh/MocA family oxidoreductase [Ectothiorhodospiraceae bacterium AqS1]